MSDGNDWTPRPGERVSSEEEGLLIAAFERRFRVNTEGRHPKVPTWVTFDASDSRRASPRVFKARSLPDHMPVYLYFEGGEVRRTTMHEVRLYLAALEPWEDWDLYVFDASMTWCIALTHPQMKNQRLVITAGTFPPRA